jgi:hypothetical protein
MDTVATAHHSGKSGDTRCGTRQTQAVKILENITQLSMPPGLRVVANRGALRERSVSILLIGVPNGYGKNDRQLKQKGAVQ